jgi:hypothetical protein
VTEIRPDRRTAGALERHLQTMLIGICTAAATASASIVWNGSLTQTRQGEQLTNIAASMTELKAAAAVDRARLDAYMPRTEIESKLDVLRAGIGDSSRRIDRLEGNRR